MVDIVPFRLKLTGSTSDQHQFQGYDGFTALAGFAWTLALVAQYSETGEIRHRGEFPGRSAVKAGIPKPGSLLVDFSVWLQQNPAEVFGVAGVVATGTAAAFYNDLVKRIIARNLGQETVAKTPLLLRLLEDRDGDVEALVARAEPAIRQSHSVIGKGATNVAIMGGHSIINNFNK